MPPVGKPGGWGCRAAEGTCRSHNSAPGEAKLRKQQTRDWEASCPVLGAGNEAQGVCVSQASPSAAERNAPPQPLAPVLHVCTLRPSDKDASPVKPGPLSPRLHWVQSAKTRFPNEVTLGGAVRLPHAFSCGARSHGTEGAHGWMVTPGETAPGRGALRLPDAPDKLVPSSGAGLQTRGCLKVEIGFMMSDTRMCDSSLPLSPYYGQGLVR